MRKSDQKRPAGNTAPDARALTGLLQSVLRIVIKAAGRQGIDSQAVIEDAMRATGADTEPGKRGAV